MFMPLMSVHILKGPCSCQLLLHLLQTKAHCVLSFTVYHVYNFECVGSNRRSFTRGARALHFSRDFSFKSVEHSLRPNTQGPEGNHKEMFRTATNLMVMMEKQTDTARRIDDSWTNTPGCMLHLKCFPHQCQYGTLQPLESAILDTLQLAKSFDRNNKMKYHDLL